MSDKTGIQWTDATWNPLRARDRETGAEGWACVRVSPGCVHCYAATLNATQRWNRGTGRDYVVGALEKVEHYIHEETLTQPLRWSKPRRVFVCSMTDLFGEWVSDEQIDRVFAVMALTPQHTYQVLTKRPERMRQYLTAGHEYGPPSAWERISRLAWEQLIRVSWPLPNVWLGVSVEDQERADERIPLLLDTPAAVRFLSMEPLLGPVDLNPTYPGTVHGPDWLGDLDWVIVGGESGAGARPFDIEDARLLVQQCREAGVAVFVKQLGSNPAWGAFEPIRLKHNHGGNPDEWPEDLRVREWPREAVTA